MIHPDGIIDVLKKGMCAAKKIAELKAKRNDCIDKELKAIKEIRERIESSLDPEIGDFKFDENDDIRRCIPILERELRVGGITEYIKESGERTEYFGETFSELPIASITTFYLRRKL